MWVKLTGEFVNLDHIFRAKVNKAFKNGHDEWVVELDGIISGELQYITRYRGIDAEVLMHALELHSRLEPIVTPTEDSGETDKNTLHDVRIF